RDRVRDGEPGGRDQPGGGRAGAGFHRQGVVGPRRAGRQRTGAVAGAAALHARAAPRASGGCATGGAGFAGLVAGEYGAVLRGRPVHGARPHGREIRVMLTRISTPPITPSRLGISSNRNRPNSTPLTGSSRATTLATWAGMRCKPRKYSRYDRP